MTRLFAFAMSARGSARRSNVSAIQAMSPWAPSASHAARRSRACGAGSARSPAGVEAERARLALQRGENRCVGPLPSHGGGVRPGTRLTPIRRHPCHLRRQVEGLGAAVASGEGTGAWPVGPNSRRRAAPCSPSSGTGPSFSAGAPAARVPGASNSTSPERRRHRHRPSLRMGDEVVEFVQGAAGDVRLVEFRHRLRARTARRARRSMSASSAGRLATRSVLLTKRGSFASGASPSTSAQRRAHSRSFWIARMTDLPSAQAKAP